MIPEEQVCNPELAIQLLNLNVCFPSLFIFEKEDEEFVLILDEGSKVIILDFEIKDFLKHKMYPSYTSSELDRMLHSQGFAVNLTDVEPFDPENSANDDGYFYNLVSLDHAYDFEVPFKVHNGADAKALGLIWLLEEEIVYATELRL